MKKEFKNLSQFELLSENSDGFLVSGFSMSITSNTLLGGTVGVNVPCTTNNCSSGNCVAGCGSTVTSN